MLCLATSRCIHLGHIPCTATHVQFIHRLLISTLDPVFYIPELKRGFVAPWEVTSNSPSTFVPLMSCYCCGWSLPSYRLVVTVHNQFCVIINYWYAFYCRPRYSRIPSSGHPLSLRLPISQKQFSFPGNACIAQQEIKAGLVGFIFDVCGCES